MEKKNVKVALTSINLNVNGTKIEMTVDQAKELLNILKQTFDKKGGVCRVCLKKEGQQKGYTVAINVLRYFGNLRDFNIETISYHKDGNITNNHIDNLSYHTTDTVANRYTKYKSKINCSFVKARQKYRVRLLINKVYHNIGYFETELEAMKAYDDFIVKHNLKRKGNFIDNRQQN